MIIRLNVREGSSYPEISINSENIISIVDGEYSGQESYIKTKDGRKHLIRGSIEEVTNKVNKQQNQDKEGEGL